MMNQPDEWQAPYNPPQQQNASQQQPLPPPPPYEPRAPYQQPVPHQAAPYQVPASLAGDPTPTPVTQQPVTSQPALNQAAPYQPASTPASYQPAPYQRDPSVAHQLGTQPQYSPYGYPTAPPQNGLGIWSLVLGILSVVMFFSCLVGFLAAVPALITGYKSRRACREGLADNGGMALGGIITGWVTIGLTASLIIVLIFLGVGTQLAVSNV